MSFSGMRQKIISWFKLEIEDTEKTLKIKQEAVKDLLTLFVLDLFSVGQQIDEKTKKVLMDTKANVLARIESLDDKFKSEVNILINKIEELDEKGKAEIKTVIDNLRKAEEEAREMSWNYIKSDAKYFTTIQDIIKLRGEILSKMDEWHTEYFEEAQHLLDELFSFESTIKAAIGTMAQEFEKLDEKFKAYFKTLSDKFEAFRAKVEMAKQTVEDTIEKKF